MDFVYILSRKKEIAATLIVVAFFLIFWINGPVFKQLEIVNIETVENEYTNPTLLNEKDNELSKYNTINIEDDFYQKGYFSLIGINDKNFNSYKIISTKENKETKNNIKQKLIKNLSFILKDINTYTFDLIYQEVPILVVKNAENNLQYVYVESDEKLNNIKGYAGPIKIGVLIDKYGNLKNLQHISSKETESYLRKIITSGYYEQFSKISVNEGEQTIDAVTGATISSQAISKTASELINLIYPNPLNYYIEVEGFDDFLIEAKLNKYWIAHLIVIFLLFYYGLNKRLKKSKNHVIIISLLSVIYIGFFLNNSFTYITFLHPFLGTSISMFTGLYAFMVLMGAIWGKNTYCKYVCPFGNIQRLIIFINPLKTNRKFFLSNIWIKRIRTTITLILLAGVLLGMRSWSNYELFPDLFGLSVLSVCFVVAVITVLTTLIYPMIWCRLLCPTGSILDTISNITSSK